MKKYLKSRLPSPESILGQKWLGPLAPWLAHPRLWHLHRRAVALGVAIGLVTGLIPGPVQMLLAVLIAIPLRANIPAAVFATFYTNPLTFVPLYILAYHIGALVTGETGNPSIPPEIDFTWSSVVDAFPDLLRWFVSLGDTLLIGLAIQSSLFALSGYVATSLVWRVAVGRLWRNRHARRG